jgi:uncharacterized FlgJ-related protein
MKKIIYALVVVSTIDLLEITSNTKFQTNEINEIKITSQKVLKNKDAKLLFLYLEIIENDIKHPDIVLAQAILESGYLSSPIFIENNNLFGMRFPERRPTVALSENRGYSVYDCWTDSVKDYKLFQEFLFRRKEKTRDEYFDYLDRIYAEDSNYVPFLKKVIEDNKTIIDYNLDLYKKFKTNTETYEYNKKLCELPKPMKVV